MTLPTTGRLLVATPTLLEPTFHRTVILVLDHTPAGAYGVVINRASIMDVAEPLPTWAPVAAPPAVVFHGGPVEVSSVLCLAWGDDAAGAAHRHVYDELGLVDLHRSPDDLVGIEGIRVFAGHAGWGPGQLDRELAERTWIVCAREPEDLRTAEPDSLWAGVLARQDGLLPLLSGYPEDVDEN